jgi:hypothetical protein
MPRLLESVQCPRQIHSHICATAYPVLEAVGELLDTRLKVAPGGAQGDVSQDLKT